jgi:hypothetical protein
MIEDVAGEVEGRENEAVDEPAGIAELDSPVSKDAPNVDELEGRLQDLQGAMDQIQSGDLEAAERAIEALEDRMGSREAQA